MATIMNAMKDKQVEEQIKELVQLGKIVIVDQQENVILEKEMSEEFGIKRQNSQAITYKEKSAKKAKNGGMTTESEQSDKNSQIDIDLNLVNDEQAANGQFNG